MAATVLLLGRAYSFGSRDLPAPQATLMKTIIEGVLAGALPWGLVLTGGGLSIAAMLCGISGLAFAIGVYLPLSSMAPIFLGGAIRAFCDRGRAGGDEAHPGVLAASGLVAGEGLAGVLIAALVASGVVSKFRPPLIAGPSGTLILIALVSAFLWRSSIAPRVSSKG